MLMGLISGIYRRYFAIYSVTDLYFAYIQPNNYIMNLSINHYLCIKCVIRTSVVSHFVEWPNLLLPCNMW